MALSRLTHSRVTGEPVVNPEANSWRIDPYHHAWPIVVFSATVAVLISLVVKMFLVTEVSTPLVVAIAAISGLLIVSPRVFDLAELTISKDGLVAKIKHAEEKAEVAEKAVKEAEKKIDRLFAYTMSDSMYRNLKKIVSGAFGSFENSGGLRTELRHLRDVGYIQVKGHIGELPRSGVDLSVFVTATQVGKDFVALRDSIEAESKPANEG